MKEAQKQARARNNGQRQEGSELGYSYLLHAAWCERGLQVAAYHHRHSNHEPRGIGLHKQLRETTWETRRATMRRVGLPFGYGGSAQKGAFVGPGAWAARQLTFY